MIMTSREIPGLTPAGPGGIALRPCFHFNIPITQGDVPRLYRRRVVTTPLSYMMHTRAERKMLPSRQPARGAAARPASLENGRDHSCLADGEFIVNKRQRAARGHIREAAFFGILTKIEVYP